MRKIRNIEKMSNLEFVEKMEKWHKIYPANIKVSISRESEDEEILKNMYYILWDKNNIKENQFYSEIYKYLNFIINKYLYIEDEIDEEKLISRFKVSGKLPLKDRRLINRLGSIIKSYYLAKIYFIDDYSNSHNSCQELSKHINECKKNDTLFYSEREKDFLENLVFLALNTTNKEEKKFLNRVIINYIEISGKKIRLNKNLPKKVVEEINLRARDLRHKMKSKKKSNEEKTDGTKTF